jgi:hypothetical protein
MLVWIHYFHYICRYRNSERNRNYELNDSHYKDFSHGMGFKISTKCMLLQISPYICSLTKFNTSINHSCFWTKQYSVFRYSWVSFFLGQDTPSTNTISNLGTICRCHKIWMEILTIMENCHIWLSNNDVPRLIYFYK